MNHGCITSCVHISGSTSVVVRLQVPIELSKDHRVIVWTDEGHLAAIAPPEFSKTSDDLIWQFDRERSVLDFFAGDIMAIAVAYRGVRLGAWWSDDWWRSMKELAETEDPEEAAARARWFRLPLLDRRHAGTIQAMSEQYGLDFAKAWLVWQDNRENRQPLVTDRVDALVHLRPPVADPAWYEVVRELLATWTPDADDARDLAASFEESARTFDVAANCALPLIDMVDRVAEAAPLLLGRLVRQWLESQPESPSHTRPLLSEFQKLLRPASKQNLQQDSSLEFDPRLPDFRLSDRFVDQLLETADNCSSGRTPDDHALENLQQLIQHPSVSRLVAANLLETIAFAY